MKDKTQIAIKLLLLGLLLASNIAASWGQSNFFKIPITQSGIYKVTSDDAKKMGSSNLESLSIYGQEGMLPQKLGTTELGLKEIPSWIKDGQLFVFLPGPHTLKFINDTLLYQHHIYADTAYYLIQSNKLSPKRINSSTSNNNGVTGSFLYQIYPYKKESHNLLSSGRKWYSNKLYSGGISSFNITVSPYDQGPIYFQTGLMAQSFTNSELSIRSGSTVLTKINIEAIPNTDYGIKGREGFSQGFVDYFDVGTITSFNLEMQNSDGGGVGYLDYFLLGLPYKTDQLSSGLYFSMTDKNLQFSIEENNLAWDVTDIYQTSSLAPNSENSVLLSGHKLLVFDPSQVKNIPSPIPVSLHLRNQNIDSELLIITHPSLLYQANRLADHKNSIGIKTMVVDCFDIYNAYSSGTKDITAIRNFLADHHLRSGQLKQVLLFGKGTFDYKNIISGRPNLVPTYSSRNSLDPLKSFSSDDYFGFLEDGQGEWKENESGDHVLSIGVGRIPAINPYEAQNIVDKIIHYETLSRQQGNWKRKLLFIADDGDNNTHLRHSEAHIARINQKQPAYLPEKFYLDNFEQIQDGDYQSAPSAKASLEEKINEGVLLANYIGHGNESTLTAERIFQSSDLHNWPEHKHFPVLVTATCEFGRQDSPYLRCGAEELLLAKKKGAIALLSTGRPVFSSINFELNKAFIEALLNVNHGQPIMLGDLFKSTKNNSLNGPFNRNFSLIGDPSLKLPLPDFSIASSILQPKINIETDTIKGGEKVLVKGTITDPLTGGEITNFDGSYLLELFDSPVNGKTLGNEGPQGSYIKNDIILHRGTGTINEGQFEAELFLSPDLHQAVEKGLIRFFASDNKRTLDAFDSKEILIGGGSDKPATDQKGPEISLFAEDSTKQIQAIPSTRLRLLARLSDESGIRLSPFPEGQSITLDVNNKNTIILNEFYQAINSSFTEGIIDMEVSGLHEGHNTLGLTAFDNLGNSSTQRLDIVVRGSTKLKILSHTVYPNPSRDISRFLIKHNRPDENIILQVKIYNLMGREIFSLEKRLVKAGNEINDVDWIFLRDKTKIPAKGTYIYRLQLISEADGTSDSASGKISIQ